MSEEKILVPKGRRTKQVIQPNELVVCVKVALRDTERKGNFKFLTFGKEIYKPKKNFLREGYKKKLGMAGVMTKEDFENGAFKEYGLDAESIKGHTTLDQQAKKIAELEAKLAEQEAKKAADSEIKKDPIKKEEPIKTETK